MLDIMIARLTHVEWVYQLEMALQRSSASVNLRSYNECELGLWLYGEALRVYEEIPEVELLEKSHKTFHIAADSVARWHNGPKISPRQAAQAQVDFEEALRMSKEVVYLLTLLELKMLRRFQEHEETSSVGMRDMILHPVKTLGSLFGGKTGKLNVSKVSLDLLKDDIRNKRG